jgi:hypothetical protein
MAQNNSTVNPNPEIKAQDFNTIESAVSNVIRGYYGYQGAASLPVTAKTNIITTNQINGVIKDINRCNIHQINTYSGLSFVSTSTEIMADFFGSLASAAVKIVNNKKLVDHAQILSDNTNAYSTRSTVWGSTITHSVVYSWNDVQAQYFFNLGGYIQPSINLISYGTNSRIDQTWVSLINQAEAMMSTSSYTKSDFTTSTNIKSIVSLSSGANTLHAQFNKISPSSIEYTLTMNPEIFSAVDIQFKSDITNYYSCGDLGGISAPRPSVSSIDLIGKAGSVVPHLKTLSATLSTSTFTASAGGGPTNSAFLTLENTGNTTLTITSFIFNNGDSSITGQIDPSVKLPIVIFPNTSKTVLVSYSGANFGVYSSSISIFSDNDQGTVIVKTIQNITTAVFILALLPESVDSTITNIYQIPQQFTILYKGGQLQSYTASINSMSGFTIDTLNVDGPIVIFDPISANLMPGTYTTTVTVTATSTYGVTTSISAPISYIYTPVTTHNLGLWLSPLDANNAVVGFSYDVIGTQRYLTMGFGVGADGSSTLSGGGSFTTPGTYSYTVPNGVTQLAVQIKGGAGGGGGNDRNTGHDGSDGAGASGYMNVTPGQVYTIIVGGGGSGGDSDAGDAHGGVGGLTSPSNILLSIVPNKVLHNAGDYSDGPVNSETYSVTNNSASPQDVNIIMEFFYGSHVITYSRIYRSDGTKLFDSGSVGWNFNVVYHSTQYVTFTVKDTIPAYATQGYYAQMQTAANGDYNYSVGPNGLYSLYIAEPMTSTFNGGNGSNSGPVPISGAGGGGGAASAILLNNAPVVVAGGGGGGGGGGNNSPGEPAQPTYNNTTLGSAGTQKDGDGGGAGGGGGGYPYGGAGGAVQGGDNGGFSGTSGQSLIPSTMSTIPGSTGGIGGIRGLRKSSAGQDGSVIIVLPWANPRNLGAFSDLAYNQGTILYASCQQSSYCPLLQSYGAWINNSGLPLDIDITRTYTITAPDTGIYDWKFAVNSTGYFNIDGFRIGDLTNLSPTNYTRGISGSMRLTAGTHTLLFSVNNSSSIGSRNTGAIALTLVERSSKTMVWCTLYPVRVATPYKYWQEVSRIPLIEDGTTHTYQSKQYLVKDILPVSNQNRWGDYFGSGTAGGSMFTIRDDGYGNLKITFNVPTSNTGNSGTQQTVNNVKYLPYYYSTADSRYINLQGPINGNQTQYFLGFNGAGNVNTSIVKKP